MKQWVVDIHKIAEQGTPELLWPIKSTLTINKQLYTKENISKEALDYNDEAAEAVEPQEPRVPCRKE